MADNEQVENIDVEWDKPLVCPIDPELLAECEACQ